MEHRTERAVMEAHDDENGGMWNVFHGVGTTGLYARRWKSSPPVVLRSPTWTGLDALIHEHEERQR
jgi:hypothetical protein